MPYFELQKEDTRFPPAHFADGEGLLAVGGTMTAEQLLKAYSEGIFYWHHPMKHVRWWSPDPRIVADPLELVDGLEEDSGIVKEQAADKEPGAYEFRLDHDPEGLLRFFQKVYNKKEEMGPSWLSERMFRIFMGLHERGLALSQEVYQDGERVGGFFGVCIGEICYGEYAAALVRRADTAAISTAALELAKRGIRLMDMHKPTARDENLPYEELSRVAYVDRCKANAAKYPEYF